MPLLLQVSIASHSFEVAALTGSSASQEETACGPLEMFMHCLRRRSERTREGETGRRAPSFLL